MASNNHHDDKVTESDLDKALAPLLRAMQEGFGGVHARLDRVNGRLDKHDDGFMVVHPRLTEHHVKLQNLHREVFAKPEKEVKSGDATAITRRDLAVFMAAFLVLETAIGGVVWLVMTLRPVS